MIYSELKEFLESLTDDQLQQPVVVFEDDDENGKMIIDHEVSFEDFYWDHSDCLGNLETVKKENPDDWEDLIRDATKVPAGTVTLHI